MSSPVIHHHRRCCCSFFFFFLLLLNAVVFLMAVDDAASVDGHAVTRITKGRKMQMLTTMTILDIVNLTMSPIRIRGNCASYDAATVMATSSLCFQTVL